MPPNNIISEKCEIDPKFINEHILEVVSESEYRSLSGKSFKTIDHELHMINAPDGMSVYCTIMSSDLYCPS